MSIEENDEITFDDVAPINLSDLKLDAPGTGHNASLMREALRAYRASLDRGATVERLSELYEPTRDDYATAPKRAVDRAWDGIPMVSPNRNRPDFEPELLNDFKRTSIKEVEKLSLDEVNIDLLEIIRTLFNPDDLICIEGAEDSTAKVVRVDRLKKINDGRKFLNPSVFNSTEATEGHMIPRTNDNVLERRYMVLECDNDDANIREKFITFCMELAKFIPLVMAVDTGGKSVHFWFDAPNGWNNEVQTVFNLSCRHGADSRMGIDSQKARMPNVSAAPDRKDQRLIYFDSAARGRVWDTEGALDRFTKKCEDSFLEQLNSMIASSPENITEMEKMARDAVFILPKIAMGGQMTIINARPSVGKTLLCCWLLSQRDAATTSGYRIFYVNADDTFEDAIEKSKKMTAFGIDFLIPNQCGFSIEKLRWILISSIETKSAGGMVFALDTLKKFVDMMDKGEARKLCGLFREFVQAGGTLIALAHTNKNKGADGKSVAEGVGDFLNDFDCCYIADEIESPGDRKTIVFSNEKLRGPNAKKVTFTYDGSERKNWVERFDSVQMLGNKEAVQTVADIEADKTHEIDKSVIDYICARLKNGELSKRAITQDDLGNGMSRGRREKVLDRYTDENAKFEYQYWTVHKGATGGQVYSLNDCRALL